MTTILVPHAGHGAELEGRPSDPADTLHRRPPASGSALDHLRIEVTSVIRRHARTGQLAPEQADAALSDLLAFPITVLPTAGLLRRVWELRANLTAYDGCYIALAEATESPFVTADRRLPQSPGPRCPVEVL